MKLCTVSNTKIMKGEDYGYLSAGLHLAPHKISGFNVCQNASPQCKEGCLYKAGHGVYSTTQEARIKRTVMLFNDPKTFAKLLIFDLKSHVKKANKEGYNACFRCNLTSDFPFHLFKVDGDKTIFDLFEGQIQFYDYTKRPKILRDKVNGKLPANYHITFSRSENNDAHCFEALLLGINVAVVMTPELIAQLGEFRGRLKFFNGDITDLRFLDPKGHGGHGRIIFLKAKGPARKQVDGGFVMCSMDELNAFNKGFNAYLRSIKVKA